MQAVCKLVPCICCGFQSFLFSFFSEWKTSTLCTLAMSKVQHLAKSLDVLSRLLPLLVHCSTAFSACSSLENASRKCSHKKSDSYLSLEWYEPMLVTMPYGMVTEYIFTPSLNCKGGWCLCCCTDIISWWLDRGRAAGSMHNEIQDLQKPVQTSKAENCEENGLGKHEHAHFMLVQAKPNTALFSKDIYPHNQRAHEYVMCNQQVLPADVLLHGFLLKSFVSKWGTI